MQKSQQAFSPRATASKSATVNNNNDDNNNSSLNINLSGLSNFSSPFTTSASKALPRFVHQLVGEAVLADSSSNNISINASSNALMPEESVADVLHTRIESRTDYLVSTPDTDRVDKVPVCIRVQISDSDESALSNCGSHYLKPTNLRKLLYLNPHLALILHDCIIEEGVASQEY